MGAWIEISGMTIELSARGGRTPRWVRGLKLPLLNHLILLILSHPTMGAWIEILFNEWAKHYVVSHPTMGAWIEINLFHFDYIPYESRTPRWVRGLK